MGTGREGAVLFAELIGAAELYARAGDEPAHEAVARALERAAQAAAACGAQVLKTIGSRLMLLAESADSAARAAVAMHEAADEAAAAGGLGLGVGFHFGPILRRRNDVFGGTVNLAARLVEQAARGQILLAAETALALGWRYASATRRLYAVPLKGRSEEVELCELVWRADQGVTYYPTAAEVRSLGARLTLSHGGRRLVLQDRSAPLTLGRGDDCELVLKGAQASRHHCTIHQRNGHFVVVDRSTNGTYVTVEGEDELLVAHGELTLRKRGWLSFGIPRGEAAEAVEFACD